MKEKFYKSAVLFIAILLAMSFLSFLRTCDNRVMASSRREELREEIRRRTEARRNEYERAEARKRARREQLREEIRARTRSRQAEESQRQKYQWEKDFCAACDGSGRCRDCGGSGQVSNYFAAESRFILQDCLTCLGSGNCKWCYGTGKAD